MRNHLMKKYHNMHQCKTLNHQKHFGNTETYQINIAERKYLQTFF